MTLTTIEKPTRQERELVSQCKYCYNKNCICINSTHQSIKWRISLND